MFVHVSIYPSGLATTEDEQNCIVQTGSFRVLVFEESAQQKPIGTLTVKCVRLVFVGRNFDGSAKSR